ncbi:MAG: GNAT family N-acetyltransferase [Erysipelotrichaceae bacterium]|nr:GNAT family N-acetyltransferase [Erysipelotrichaceae bacterium]
MIYELTDPAKAAPVFAGWEDAGIIACLDNVMGKIFADDMEHPKSVMAVIGDFAYLAGEPNLELVRSKPDQWMLVVPQNEAWQELIENNFSAYKQIRYAIRKDTKFDREKLEAMANALPEGYTFRKIDGELYDVCLEIEMFEEAVSSFESKEKYLELGRGFAVMKEDKIVAVASSYSRNKKGIDIEIDTIKEEQQKGLGSAVAAKLILECLDEGLYPAWDAASKLSVRLAEKLGYEFSHEYVCYQMN